MTRVNWHVSGLRRIGSLFESAATWLETRLPDEPRCSAPQKWPSEEFIDDVRHRIYLRGFL